jgi:hypothetical protein
MRVVRACAVARLGACRPLTVLDSARHARIDEWRRRATAPPL